MIPRRSLVTGGVLGSLLGGADAGEALALPNAAGAAADVTDETLRSIAAAIQAVRTDLERHRSFSDIAAVRDVQKTYLRANGRLTDYIDAGMDVWFAVHDWHVRWQQPLSVARDNAGRYTIVLHGTVLVLHAESLPAYIGPPYDARQA